jgi:hypothetical protein
MCVLILFFCSNVKARLNGFKKKSKFNVLIEHRVSFFFFRSSQISLVLQFKIIDKIVES